MLELLFGNENVERILFYLINNNKCYAKLLSDQFHVALSPMQRTLQKLERAGLLISFNFGKTKMYEFNPRYPFLEELKAFSRKAYMFVPQADKLKYYEPVKRRRPRRTGKPLRVTSL